VREAQKQVAAIFSDWLRDYGGIPIKIARSFAANPDDQCDLLQEMYLQLWRSVESFAAQSSAIPTPPGGRLSPVGAFLIGASILMAVCYAVWKINQYAARKHLGPRLQRLRQTLAEIESE
jgi:hypothetical protein